jgi:hypothetical protein
MRGSLQRLAWREPTLALAPADLALNAKLSPNSAKLGRH